MKFKEIYEFFVQEGIKADLRSKKQIQSQLQSAKAEYKKLTRLQKKFFDTERFKNPYSDTRILFGNLRQPIVTIMIGIDIGVGELLMAKQLEPAGKKIDLVISHHPCGIGLAGLAEVMSIQTDILKNYGMNSDVAEDFMGKRIGEVTKGLHSANHNRVVDAARLLDIPFMCCHTPADNHVVKYLQKLMSTKKPRTLKHVVDMLLKEPEYQEAARMKVGPVILQGRETDKAGKIIIDMTGGTEGSKEIFGRLSQLGVDTQISMHISKDHLTRVKAEHINLINAGHMASDALGLNLLLDKLIRRSRIEVVSCSGFKRVKR